MSFICHLAFLLGLEKLRFYIQKCFRNAYYAVKGKGAMYLYD